MNHSNTSMEAESFLSLFFLMCSLTRLRSVPFVAMWYTIRMPAISSPKALTKSDPQVISTSCRSSDFMRYNNLFILSSSSRSMYLVSSVLTTSNICFGGHLDSQALFRCAPVSLRRCIFAYQRTHTKMLE
jgi:hypothetical protein